MGGYYTGRQELFEVSVARWKWCDSSPAPRSSADYCIQTWDRMTLT